MRQPEQEGWQTVSMEQFLEMLDALMGMYAENLGVAQAGIDMINSEMERMREWEARGYRLSFHYNPETSEVKVEKHTKNWGLPGRKR